MSGIRTLHIAGRNFASRLFAGTGKFASGEAMQKALIASGAQLVTVALKRVDPLARQGDILEYLRHSQWELLPNTSGARTAREAVFTAQMAREALETNWIKLEIHPDPRHLLPDPVETLAAAGQLVREGFVVLPYCGADPVLCKRLEEAGAAAVMPLGSPIGSNRGLETRAMLELIIEQAGVPVVVDAGLGAPSHAAAAMEMGADAVLVNTAVAVAGNPSAMAAAFKKAVEAGREAFEAGLGLRGEARATSPTESLTGFLQGGES